MPPAPGAVDGSLAPFALAIAFVFGSSAARSDDLGVNSCGCDGTECAETERPVGELRPAADPFPFDKLIDKKQASESQKQANNSGDHPS